MKLKLLIAVRATRGFLRNRSFHDRAVQYAVCWAAFIAWCVHPLTGQPQDITVVNRVAAEGTILTVRPNRIVLINKDGKEQLELLQLS